MTEIDPKLAAEAQKFKPDTVVILYDIDLRSLGGEIMRFIPELEDENAQPVTWRGEEYLPCPIVAQGFETQSTGQFPRPKIIVANVLGTIKQEVLQYSNLIGATVTRWRTFAKFLDNGDDPDPDVYFPPDIYKIERKSADTPVSIEFELSTVLDQQGVQLPRRQIIRGTCTKIYRVYDDEDLDFDYTKATCPYTGTDYFDVRGNPVATPDLDKPSKQFKTCCKKRFPGQPLPTGAFPGVGRFR